MTQTNYSMYQGRAYAGTIHGSFPKEVLSFSVETAAGADFGIAVSRGTDKERQVVIGGASFIGITLRTLDREGDDVGAIRLDLTDTASVMRTGYANVVCPSGCDPGDVANYIDATGVIDSGTPGAGETAIAGGSWETVTAAGEIGVLRIGGV